MKLKLIRLLISLVFPLAVGFVGSLLTSGPVNSWYASLNKPAFNPPSWVFAPVWTLLFILMGLSFYFAWNVGGARRLKIPFLVYFIQLILNLLWSLFFFSLRSPLLAFIDIVLLWLAILANIYLFYRVRRVAGYLLIPYFLWVSFASVLNFTIIILN